MKELLKIIKIKHKNILNIKDAYYWKETVNSEDIDEK